MEKSTISALILAGAGVLVAVVRMFVLWAIKKRKSEEYETAIKEKEEGLPEKLKDT